MRRLASSMAIIATLSLSAACLGGDGDDPAPTPSGGASATNTAAQRTPTSIARGTRTPTPSSAPAGSGRAPSVVLTPLIQPTRPSGGAPINFSPAIELTAEDLAARGAGTPGRGAFNIARIIVAASGIDAPVTSAVVGPDGRMPDPPSLDVAVWYDFADWPGLGGLPGAGGNVVIAGDAIKPAGVGVFTKLNPEPGNYVRLQLTDGSIACYRIEFKKIATADLMEAVVAATADESITLVTGASPGRTWAIFWGRRADCRLEPPATPTRTPTSVPTDRHTLRIVAENYTFTVVEGAVVPSGKTAVDYFIDHRDAGVEHSIAFYSPAPRQVGGSGAVLGPTQDWSGLFGVGPPDLAGEYTFVCQIHPQMTGSFTVLP